MKRFFFDVEIKLPATMLNEGMQRVYSIVHGVLSGTGEYRPNIGLCFPHWQPGHKEHHTSMGKVIRMVGTREELQMMYHHTHLNGLCDDGLIEMAPIMPVPKNAREVIFKRDRTIERTYRLFKQGEVTKREFKEREVTFPYFKISSKSSQKKFRCYVKMVEVTEPKVGFFTNYGLSSDGTTVPIF